MPENIILVGFMGTGKTTIGRMLARSLGYPMVDTDQLIEESQGQSIPEIFAGHGEEAFRKLETATLSAFSDASHQVISTGGGIIVTPENRPLLKSLGYVVWLRTSPREILNRTSRNRNRPLLDTPNPMATITALLEERTPLYRESSHLSIETDHLNFEEIIAGITESARYYFSQES